MGDAVKGGLDRGRKSIVDPEPFAQGLFGKPTTEERAESLDLLRSSMEPSKILADITLDQYQGTTGIREGINERLTNLLSGDYDPTQSALFAPSRRGIEDAFGTAQKNIMATQAEGGGLNESLAQSETGRARGIADIIAQIQQDEMNKAFSVATGAPGDATSGLGTAGSGQTQAAANLASYTAQQQAMAGQSASGVGAGLGALFSK